MKFICFILISMCLIINVNFVGLKNKETKYNKIIFEDYDILKNDDISEIEQKIISDETDFVNLQIQFDYNCFCYDDKEYVNVEEIDDYIKERRKLSRELHLKYNIEYLKKMDIKKYEDIYISKYSPFVNLIFKDNVFCDIYNDLIYKADKDDNVKNIYIKSHKDKNIDNLSVARVAGKVDPVVNSLNLTGNSIKVGILEKGIVNINHPNISGSNCIVRDVWYYFENVTEHATKVASIIGGNNGIAPNTQLFSVELYGDPESEIEWLLDNNVNIINMSFGDLSPTGNYSSNSAYMDYICVNQMITLVASSGNTGIGNGYIGNPGLGYNVITVGATDRTGTTLADYSSYNVNTGPHKPTLVAPSNIIIPIFTEFSTGTSFSAPFVTGVISLLMEYQPILKVYPERIGAIITSSSKSMDGYPITDNCGLNNKVGSGLVNLESAIEAVNNTFAVVNTSDESGTIFSTNISLEVGDKIKASLYWLVNNNNSTSVNFTDYDLWLLSPEGILIESGYSTDNNLEIIEKNISTSGIYTLVVRQFGSRGDGIRDWGSLSYCIS